MIFYERGMMAANQGLIEIKNKKFIGLLKKDYLANYSKFTSDTPLICGTVVNTAIGQPKFDRKLKMM